MTEILPIIFKTSSINYAIYSPVSSFVNYINMMTSKGFPWADLPQSYSDLYLLDFYDAQVRNGGHSQYIHNSFDNLEKNLDSALRAARLLELPDLEAIIQECKSWCEAHPEERSKQNGFSNRAEPLDDLDKRLYRLKYDDETYDRFVADQSEPFRVWITTATQSTDFYARNMYHLGAGVWLLSQPQTQVLDPGEWQPAVDKLLARFGLTGDRKE